MCFLTKFLASFWHLLERCLRFFTSYIPNFEFESKYRPDHHLLAWWTVIEFLMLPVIDGRCCPGGHRAVCADAERLLGPDLVGHLQEDLTHQVRGHHPCRGCRGEFWSQIQWIWIPDPEFWPNLDPDPGLYYQFWKKPKFINNLRKNNFLTKIGTNINV